MKYNDIILLLLIAIFIILSMYYIGCVCEFRLSGVTEAFTNNDEYVGDSSCMSTTIIPMIGKCDNCNDMTTTYDGLKNSSDERNYHTDYTCANIASGAPNKYNIDNNPYKYDIRNQHLLLAYKCVKLSPRKFAEAIAGKNIETLFGEHTFEKIGTGPGTGLDNAKIRSQINDKIKGMLLAANKTNGPIYACIAQAPYLKGQKARFDIVQHGKGCYDNGRACGDTRFLKFEILLIFLEGDSTKINKFIEIVATNSSRNALCFLNCGGIDDKDSLSMGCGCLNKDNSYTNDDAVSSQYNSVCLAPDSDFLQNPAETNKTADYSIIYFLNPHNNYGVTINRWVKPI